VMHGGAERIRVTGGRGGRRKTVRRAI
jgi:hypothetical protein